MNPLRSLLCAAVTVAAVAASAFVASPASAASSVQYVALGDSYSAGVGAGSNSGSCDRSPNAYSQLWTNANAPSSFTFVACSGATTSDVISSQLSALSSSTTLVSITIGGNDVGFADVMEDCVLDSESTCVSDIDNAESEMTSTLPTSLNTLYADIRAHAPNARVVVLGYPRFYDLNQSSGCIGLSTAKRTAINGAADELDSVIASAVSRQSNFVFGDVRSAFSANEICDSNPWLHSVNVLDLDESYHPTATGQSNAYYPVFADNA